MRVKLASEIQASLREVTSGDVEALHDFFRKNQRGGVSRRSDWETAYAIENQSLYCIESQEGILGVSGIYAYPHVDDSTWTAKPPDTLSVGLDGDKPRAYELGGTLVKGGLEGFGLQQVFLSVRMCFIRFFLAGGQPEGLRSFTDRCLIAIVDEDRGDQSKVNVGRTGFFQVQNAEDIPGDLLYPCLTDCLADGRFKRDGKCSCYNFYKAEPEDYLAKSWAFMQHKEWILTRATLYENKASGLIEKNDVVRMIVSNDTEIAKHLFKTHDIT